MLLTPWPMIEPDCRRRRFAVRVSMAALSLVVVLSLGSALRVFAAGEPILTAGLTVPVEHVVLVSIDGLRPEFYLDPSWPAPMLQQMVAEGAHADAVRGVFPSVTYPSHTTLVTGALPAHHGVYYNSPFEPGGQTGRWYWEASAIRADTLWRAVHRAGGRSAAVGWPETA